MDVSEIEKGKGGERLDVIIRNICKMKIIQYTENYLTNVNISSHEEIFENCKHFQKMISYPDIASSSTLPFAFQ